MKNFEKNRKVTQGKRCMLSRILIALLGIQLIFALNVYGQQMITVSGTVTDAQGQPLPGATVLEEGTTNGTVTNNDGFYTINVPGNATLVISFVGMRTQRVAVNSRPQIDIRMEEETIGLDEVVAIGYAQQSRMKTTASVSSITDEELKNIPSVNPIQALQGKLAGVSIPVLSGQPGAGANIVIRGGTTLRPYGENAGGRDVTTRDPSDPLVIVDGVFRDMNDVNPDDIESVQVMKDAASTAIYGARGANGVIVITTKSGRGKGKPSFTFRYQHGIENQIRNYDYLSAKEFLEVARPVMARGIDGYSVQHALYGGLNSATVYSYNQPGQYGNFKFTTAYLNNLIEVEGQEYVNNLLTQGWETMDDPVNPGNTIIFKDSHYQDVVWQTAYTQNYNFRVDGSSEAAHYNISAGYIDQGGTFIGTGYKRFSALANSGYKVNDRFNLTLNLSYLWNDDKYSDNTINDLTRGVRVPPLTRLYHDDGTPHIGEGNNPRNRPHQLYYQDFNSNTTQFVTRVSADYTIFPDLRYRPSVSLDTRHFKQMDFEKYYPEQPRPRDKYQRQDNRTQIMTDHILQFDKSINDNHNVMILGGFNYIHNTLFRVVGTSQRSPTDYISTITGDPQTSIIGGNVVANIDANSLWAEDKSSSIFGQASYDYKDRYLFGASIRRDGFSNFAPGNRYAIFPSLSAGWNISNEDFWNSELINHLKVRSSWGEAGLSNLSIGDTYGIYGVNLYATESGVTRSNIPNPNLLWETTRSFDFGFDVSMFKRRLNIVFDIYDKLTKNRLAALPLAGETGFGSIMYNVGSLRNRGIELEIQATIINNNNFKWNSNFSFAFNRSLIVELPENHREKNRINGGEVYNPKTGEYIEVGGWAEGERPDGLWAFQAEGIFATDEEAQAWNVLDMGAPNARIGTPKHGGDVKWADLDGDGIINGHDLAFMGYRIPDKIGGIQNVLNYKGITIRFVMDYAMGHVINDGALAREMGSGRSSNEGAPRQAIASNTWQKQGDTGMKYPRYSFWDAAQGQRNHLRQIGNSFGYSNVGIDNAYGVDNSIYYSKGDWLAFRELSAQYELPSRIVQKLMFEKITLNAGVYNMGYITAYTGLNPETYKGYDEGGYPRPLQITFGATFNFH
jgi:TonB-linked SusC/RagA family outer membrane protein